MKLIIAALLVSVFGLLTTPAQAQVTFRVCGDSPTGTFTTKDANGKQTEDRLFVKCPPDKTHKTSYVGLQLVGCVGPSVKRQGTEYTVTCKTWNKYELVRAK